MGGVKKGAMPATKSRIHKDRELPDDLLRFSFRHLNSNDKFGHEKVVDTATYLPQLLTRLQSISNLKLSEFRANKDSSLRAHTHDWNKTTEIKGFAHLSTQLQSCEAWQFQLSANEHGRVHGVLIDEVFYVVWLDPGHLLYA